jgi:hypothetical protein
MAAANEVWRVGRSPVLNISIAAPFLIRKEVGDIFHRSLDESSLVVSIGVELSDM